MVNFGLITTRKDRFLTTYFLEFLTLDRMLLCFPGVDISPPNNVASEALFAADFL